jgi:hypothetical protein
MMAEELLSAAGSVERLIADKAYDTNRLRTYLQQRGIKLSSLPAPGESPSARMTGPPIANEGIVMSGRAPADQGLFRSCADRGCGHVFGLFCVENSVHRP